MGIIFSTLKKILFWSYERGTWQYDIMCVLILAFIFFMPNQWFRNRWLTLTDKYASRPYLLDASEVGEIAPERIEQEVADYLSRLYSREVTVASVEEWTNQEGKKVYVVVTKE